MGNHKRVITALGAGAVLVGLTAEPVYRHFYPKRAPSIVAVGDHIDYADGRSAVNALRSAAHKQKIAVLAMENNASTKEESQEIIRQIEEKRREFIAWRAQGRPTEEQSLAAAEAFVGRIRMKNRVYVPMVAEAFVRGIAIRFIENFTPVQARRVLELDAENDREFKLAVEAPTLGEGIRHMEKAQRALDEGSDIREIEMKNEIEGLQVEFHGKGTVFAWAGKGHRQLSKTTRSERIDIQDPNGPRGLDPDTDRSLPSRVRAGRTLAILYLDAILNTQPQSRKQIDIALGRAMRMSERDIDELIRVVHQKTGNERAFAVSNTLLEWAYSEK